MSLVLVSIACLACQPGLPTDNRLETHLDKSVQAAVANFFKNPGHIGLSVAVLDGDGSYFYDYGTTNRQKPQLPTKQSLYEIASITKTFTGALASKALIDGKITLDGDFRTYLKGAYPNLQRNGKPMTLRTLATHTAGLPKDIPDSDALFLHPDFDRLPYRLIANEKPYDRSRYLKELHLIKLSTDPGTNRRYSNIGIKLIGFGLENVYEKPLSRLLQFNITRRLNMPRTTFVVSPKDKPLLVQGYSPSGKPMPYHLPNAGAAGGLYSNTEDMANYAKWQLEETSPVVQRSHKLIFGDTKSFGEGLIWDETITSSHERKLWHSGGAYGMASQLILFPDAKVAFVLLANDGGLDTQGELDKLAMEIRATQKQ